MVIGIDASRANQEQKTGTEWYSWHLIRELAKQLPDHTLRLYTREPLEPGLRNLGPQVEERVLGWRPGLLWSHLRLSWELLFHPPDVVFIPADTVPIIRRCRTVTTIHDIAFERFPELYATGSVQRSLGWIRPLVHGLVRLATLGRYSASELDYHRWSVRHALRVSQKVLTVSEFTKQEMVELLGAAPSRIVVTGQGIKQPPEFSAISEVDRSSTLQELGIDRPFFLYVGRLEKKKNIANLVRGYLEYRQQQAPAADLVLVGTPGYGWDEIKATATTKQNRSFIHQVGWQSEKALHVLQTAALGFVFLSQYEGFGRPPLESLSAGVPVVASRLGSLPEVLQQGAIYVDPTQLDQIAAALQELQSNQGQRQQLIEAGQRQVRTYTWKQTTEKTVSALLEE